MSVRQPVAFALMLCLTVSCVTGCSDAGLPVPSTSNLAAERTDASSISIQVAPATLILGSPGTWVTVHAEIAYSDVDSGTVTLNGIVPESTFPDSRGEFVAKFDRDSVEVIASPPEVTLTLGGLTASGTPFSGSETIVVK